MTLRPTTLRQIALLSCAFAITVPLAIAPARAADAVAAVAAPAAGTAAGSATLEVKFSGIEAPTGAVLFAVYDNEAAYAADGHAVREAMAPVKDGAAALSFAGLAPGHYAIKAFHDIDGDGKMGTNPFGMPTEPFAFSNDAKGNMGPAVWADARFAVGAGTTVQTITIR